MKPAGPQASLRARYIGYTKGTENHGDEALFWIVRNLLAPEIDVSGEFNKFEMALLGGGTLLNQSPWLIYEFQKHLKTAGRGMVFGTGVGDPMFWGDRFDEWLPLLQQCCYVGVRGPRSLALLEKAGFKGAQVCGDPYLSLKPHPPGPVFRGRIGVNLGTTNDSMLGGKESEFLDYMVEVLRKLKDEGSMLVWTSVWAKDLAFIRRVRMAVGRESGPVMDLRKSPSDAMRSIAGCELFIGEKLHACAVSAVAGTPFIALEYQPKVRDFTESIGMGEWTVSTAQRDPDELLRQIHDLRENRESVAAHMREHVAQLRDTLLRSAKEARASAMRKAAE